MTRGDVTVESCERFKYECKKHAMYASKDMAKKLDEVRSSRTPSTVPSTPRTPRSSALATSGLLTARLNLGSMAFEKLSKDVSAPRAPKSSAGRFLDEKFGIADSAADSVDILCLNSSKISSGLSTPRSRIRTPRDGPSNRLTSSSEIGWHPEGETSKPSNFALLPVMQKEFFRHAGVNLNHGH